MLILAADAFLTVLFAAACGMLCAPLPSLIGNAACIGRSGPAETHVAPAAACGACAASMYWQQCVSPVGHSLQSAEGFKLISNWLHVLLGVVGFVVGLHLRFLPGLLLCL